ncbi:MAG: LLM class flavin-dependent oxidoreductase, partial [Rhodospirillales bacterium]
FKGKPFSYEGEHFKFDETSVFPLPVQDPHPPIWVVGQSMESVEATAKRGFNLVTGGFGIPVERLRDFRAAYDALDIPA